MKCVEPFHNSFMGIWVGVYGLKTIGTANNLQVNRPILCSTRRRLPRLCRRPSFANRPSVTSSAWYTAFGAATAGEGTFQGWILKISNPAPCMEFQGCVFSMSTYIHLCPGIPQIDLGGGHPRDSPARTSGMSVPSRLTAVIDCANLETVAKMHR